MRSRIGTLALAYGAGLWVGLVFLIRVGVIWILLGAAALVIACWGWRSLVLAFALVGVATGANRAIRDSGRCDRAWAPGPHAALIRLNDPPGERGTATANVIYASEHCSGTLLLRLGADSLKGGIRMLAAGEYRGGGVFKVSRFRRLSGRRSWRYAIRDAASARVRRLYGPRSGVVEALVLGRRDNIPRRLRQQFTAAGLAHILAISGLHVGVLAAWIVLLVRVFTGERWAWLVSTGGVWGYVTLLGFPAPATRAAAFITILALSRWRQRHPPIEAVLGVAMLLVFVVDPAAVTSVGAWLSAAAVVGTRLGAEAVPRFRLLGASLGATLITAPITALVFGSVAPVGIVANLVAVPLAGVAVPGVFLSLLAGGVPAGGAGLVLALLEWTASRCAAFPGGHLTGSPGLGFAAPWCLVLAAAIWIRVRRPSWSRLRLRAALVAAIASWSFVIPSIGVRYRPGELTLHFLAVGQGDAIVVRTPGGSWVLIDGGPRNTRSDAGERVVLPFLRDRGVAELAAVVVTHGDADHLGGIPAVLREVAPRLALDPGQPHGTALYLEYLRALDREGTQWHAARAGDVLELDSVRFSVLHPRKTWLATHLEANDNSVVLRLDYGCFSALLTGDIEWPAESLLIPTVGDVDLLKVGHHGAPGGTTDAWLGATKPRVAVISVGANRYGHPSQAILERLFAHGVDVLRTDRGGTVTVRSDGRYLAITQGGSDTPWEGLKCLITSWLRSRGSFSSRKSCIRTPPVSLPSCSTT